MESDLFIPILFWVLRYADKSHMNFTALSRGNAAYTQKFALACPALHLIYELRTGPAMRLIDDYRAYVGAISDPIRSSGSISKNEIMLQPLGYDGSR